MRLNAVAMSILFTVNTYAVSIDGPDLSSGIRSEHFEVGLDQEAKNPLLKVDVQMTTMTSSEKSDEEISAIVAEKSKEANTTVILSTDDIDVLKAASNNITLQAENTILVPIEKNASLELPTAKKSDFSQLIKGYLKAGVDSARDDKIGLLILTYTTTSESLVWIHSTTMSQFERTGSVLYCITLAMIFGLNKDAWSNATTPIKNFYRKLIMPDSDDPNSSKELATRFLGNLTLGAAVTSLRIPLLSMDKIISSGIRLEYFTMPFLMTLVSTSAYFTWSEHLAGIDAKENPTTKFIFRRTAELRSIVAGTFATAAALLTPSEYGLTPWITVAGIGAIGATLYFNGAAITKWVESAPLLAPLRDYLAGLDNKKTDAAAMQCSSLFVY